MASSKVDICNLALIHLGCDTISAITDQNQRARLCKQVYDQLRRKLLRAHPWRFAIKRQSLAVSSSTPPFGFSYQYPLPSDCLRTLDVDLEDSTFQIEGRSVVTDETEVELRYVADIVDEQNFDDLFCEVLALDIAIKIGRHLTQSDAVIQECRQEREQILRDARSADAQEGTPGSFVSDTWLDSRF